MHQAGFELGIYNFDNMERNNVYEYVRAYYFNVRNNVGR
jgi:hypothetical protein